MENDKIQQPSRLFAYLMWSLSLSFFAFQFIFRLAPGLIIEEIKSDFMVNSSAIGTMSALYYLGYAGMQIPVAVLLDRFKPHLIIVACILTSSLGMIINANTNSWGLVVFARFLVGAGSAAGFLGVSKVIQLFFSQQYYGRMVGFSFSVGLLGAVYGGRPLTELLENFHYTTIFNVLGLIGIAIALALLILFRVPKNYKALKEPILENLLKVLTNKQILMLAVSNLLMVGTLEGFADVWGNNYLQYEFAINKKEAATFISLIFLGMLFGGPLLAYIAKIINSEINTVILSGVITITLYIFIFNIVPVNKLGLTITMFVAGLMCCYQVLVFAIGNNLQSTNLQTLTIAFLNSINMLGGSFFHTIIGNSLNSLNFDSNPSIASYKLAISVIPVATLVGILLIMLTKYQQYKRNKLVNIG